MRIAVIGAGMTGLTCARALADAGLNPVVFEKSRGLGGRLATRRIDDLRFDHGVQYMRAKRDGFRAYLDAHAARWQVDGIEGEAFVGVPGMSGLVKPMAEGLDIRLGTQVSPPARDGDRWNVNGETFDRVISTVPVDQARLLFPQLGDALAAAEMKPCWTLMVAFAAPTGWPDTVKDRGAALSWIARSSSKPDRSAAPDCWVVQASAAWSVEYLELDKAEACERMLSMLRKTRGALPEISFAAAHRWRYSRTSMPLERSHVASDDGTVLIGGDWCLGARVEDAWDSGLAMANAVLEQISA